VIGRRTRIAVALAAGVALVGAAPAGAGAPPKKKVVHLGDNYFLPGKLTVKPKTRVVWKWPGFESSGQVHDVKLRKGPKGVKRFHSDPAASDFSFSRRLTVPGTYRLVCTYHEEMTMTIKVRR
jgi:plastocyanin